MADPYTFTAADNVLVTPPGEVPLAQSVETMLWESQEYDTTAEGADYSTMELLVEYHSFDPDTTDPANQPFNFEVTVAVHVKQDGEWVEIGRQFTPLRKVTQGRKRKIIISPNMVLEEEGIDQWIFGLGGEPSIIKSRTGESARGNIKICLFAIDHDPTGPNPFAGVTFSVRGKRYDV